MTAINCHQQRLTPDAIVQDAEKGTQYHGLLELLPDASTDHLHVFGHHLVTVVCTNCTTIRLRLQPSSPLTAPATDIYSEGSVYNEVVL
jgi:hypothetical protein